ncbi:MAG: magnesium transporter [Bdellovibrionales bacterium]
MLESRTKLLVSSVRKLYRRGAWRNIRRILDKTHSPDLGLLLEELDRAERSNIFQLISSEETRAEVLSYVEAKTQKDLLTQLDKQEVKSLVSKMESDDAADLLGGLPKEFSEEILGSMQREDSEEVADLMRYPEDSAGGLMNTDFLAMDYNLTVEEAIKDIQDQDEETLISFYVYVIDESEHLVGVLSLKNLILSKPYEKLRNIMTTELISANISTDQEEVAKIVEHYDFLSLPVVDGDNKLEGIITVDDVIDVIREESVEDLKAMGRIGGEDESFAGQFRGRFPWLIFSFFGGLIAFLLVRSLGADYGQGMLLTMASAIPLILSMGAVTGGQSTVFAVSLAASGKFENGFKKYVINELGLAFIVSIIFAFVSYWIFDNVFELNEMSLRLSIALVLQMNFASLLGTWIPILLYKSKFDPAVSSVPLFTVTIDLLGLLFLFGWANLA